MHFLISLVGIVVLLLIAYLLSSNRQAINIRTVAGAFFIQISIGAFVLYSEVGAHALARAADVVTKIISYSDAGIHFLFGALANEKIFESLGESGFIFALRVLPTIIFFSSFISVLYYLGIMQWGIRIIGGILQKILGTSKTESMSAAANIFVGHTEAPLLIRPYIASMTESELFAVMCGGLASVSGAVMTGYVQMGVPLTYLIAAAFMSAPGGLLFAKILIPQTETVNDNLDINYKAENCNNIIDAAATGASSGLRLAANVGAMLLAFVALIALFNGIIGNIGAWFGYEELNLQTILGWLFQPLAYIIGVPWSEANIAGAIIGQKLVLNEFVAYSDFVHYLNTHAPALLTEKTKAIITFALCGFANFSSIAILIGGLGTMAPSRRQDIARLGLKAVIAGTLSNLMSATMAGLFIS